MQGQSATSDGTHAKAARRGRPSRIERENLIAVALQLGPENLALSVVAKSLDVPRTTVYNYVRTPEELGQLVLSSLLDALEDSATRVRDLVSWEAQLKRYAINLRDTLIGVGPWLSYYDPDVHIGPSAIREAERIAELLVGDGFSTDTAGHALAMITAIVFEAARVHRQNLTGPVPGYLMSLSKDEFPLLARARSVSDISREDEQFRYSLGCALAGIATTKRTRLVRRPVRSK
jgi:TetR/AcrR family transcriptional regulator, tetracycline repressor protein